MAPFDCQFQSCIANALEDCPNVPGKIRSVIGCDSNNINVLSTLVSFDNWVKYSRMKLEKADRDLLRAYASLL